MKKKVKQLIPNFMWIRYRRISNYYRLKKIVNNDRKQFFRNASLYTESGYKKNQVRYRLIYAVHGIEKGLSHEELRLGFGREQLVYINSLLVEYLKLGLSKESLEYVDTIEVLSKYMKIHKEKNYDLSYFYNIYDEFILEIENCQTNRTGIFQKKKETVNKEKNFYELSQNRYSIRDFSDEKVSDEIIKQAVQISLKTPSACNRQMWNLKAITNKKKIEEVLSYQRGFTGYNNPPVLFLITVSLESFQFPRERNQAFVDGGLFAMNFIYSLEYLDIASCALNSELTLEDEKKIRTILDIDESEVMIMFVAAGYFKEEYLVCKSPRVEVNDILTIIED